MNVRTPDAPASLKKRSAIVVKNANEAAKNAKSDAAAVTKTVHDADKDAPAQVLRGDSPDTLVEKELAE